MHSMPQEGAQQLFAKEAAALCDIKGVHLYFSFMYTVQAVSSSTTSASHTNQLASLVQLNVMWEA